MREVVEIDDDEIDKSTVCGRDVRIISHISVLEHLDELDTVNDSVCYRESVCYKR